MLMDWETVVNSLGKAKRHLTVWHVVTHLYDLLHSIELDEKTVVLDEIVFETRTFPCEMIVDYHPESGSVSVTVRRCVETPE